MKIEIDDKDAFEFKQLMQSLRSLAINEQERFKAKPIKDDFQKKIEICDKVINQLQ